MAYSRAVKNTNAHVKFSGGGQASLNQASKGSNSGDGSQSKAMCGRKTHPSPKNGPFPK